MRKRDKKKIIKEMRKIRESEYMKQVMGEGDRDRFNDEKSKQA